MDEELVCTLSDWLMMFENRRSFFRLHDHGGQGSTSIRFFEISISIFSV